MRTKGISPACCARPELAGTGRRGWRRRRGREGFGGKRGGDEGLGGFEQERESVCVCWCVGSDGWMDVGLWDSWAQMDGRM